MTRNRIDDSPAPRLVVHVHDGRTSVDCEQLRAAATALAGVLDAIRAARVALAQARAVVGCCRAQAPLTGQPALAALDDADTRQASLRSLHRQVEAVRHGVVTAAAAYEEAEHTARAGARAAPAGLLWPAWISGLSPLTLGPHLVGPAIGMWSEVLAGWRTAATGVPSGVNLQGRLRDIAGSLSARVNPGGRVVGSAGASGLADLPPVPFLSSSILDLTGLDHAGGSLDVWALDPLTRTRHLTAISEWTALTAATVPIGASLAVPPLRSVPDVLRRMGAAAAGSSDTGLGRIELVAQTVPGRPTSWTVVIPGTREMFLDTNPQDHLSNVQLMGAEENDLLLAVRQALQMAPVADGDSLLFAGHSQGGIVAAELAADPVLNQRYEVAGVVTMGSPVGQVTGIPADVPVIRMENLDDAVPALDGLANTAGANHLTVQFHAPAHTAVLGAHDLRTYEAAYAQALADGGSDRLTALDGAIRDASGWSDGEATARVYTFEFARTERGREFLDALRHVSLGVR